MFRGFSPEVCRLDIVRLDAYAVIIAVAEIVLRQSITLFRGLAIPYQCFCLVQFNAFAGPIAEAEIEL